MRAIADAVRCGRGSDPYGSSASPARPRRDDRAAMIAATSASSRSRADRAHALQTFFAGQPMLMSTICAPCSHAAPGGRRERAGSRPAICTTDRLGLARWCDADAALRVRQSRGRTSSSPRHRVARRRGRLAQQRNGLSVTPAIGARNARPSSRYGPMTIGSRTGVRPPGGSARQVTAKFRLVRCWHSARRPSRRAGTHRGGTPPHRSTHRRSRFPLRSPRPRQAVAWPGLSP